MLVTMILADPAQDVCEVSNFHSRIESGKGHSVNHRPQVCAVDEHWLHHEQMIRAVGDPTLCCNPPVCVVGDHVLLESKKERVKNT